MINSSPIIVALDYPDVNSALQLVNQLSPDLCRLKVGKELFVAAGPDLVRQLVAKGFDVFLDLKFHDIPNTVAKACVAAAKLGVWMLNVHAFGGSKMMQVAREALEQLPGRKPLLIGVTVLTSMDNHDLAQIGIHQTSEQHVLHLAQLAYSAGLDGVVCSAQEAAALRAKFGPDFCLVTPGIRPNAINDDQTRVMSPKAALEAGSDYLVIGRPITQADHPLEALKAIIKTL